MKTKIFNVALAIICLVSLVGVMASTRTANAQDAGAEVTYDEAYVSLTGSDTTGNGTEDNPWRTITEAVNRLPYTGNAEDPPGSSPGVDDRINVEPTNSLWYGGAVPETIFIDEEVVLRSTDGADVTHIDVSGQAPLAAIIEVVSSNVTIEGFFLASSGPGGAPVGVYAHPPVQDGYIENVTVEECIIKLDQYEEAVGIEMFKVKYPEIDENEIYVGTEGAGLALSVYSAWGILLFDCLSSEITDNLLNVHGDFLAIGIEMELCPKSLVGVDSEGEAAPNTINVLAAGDVVAIGIKVTDSPIIDINNNIVTVEGNGNAWVVGYGIKVATSDRADVINNQVTVNSNLIGDGAGFLEAIGIRLKQSHESNIMQNIVVVKGIGNVNQTLTEEVDAGEETPDVEEDIADLDDILMNTVGATCNSSCGFGLVIGIKVKGSELVKVNGNNVDTLANLDVISGDIGEAVTLGAGVAIGIVACGSPAILVANNTVKALSDLYARADAVETAPVEFAGGLAISAGMGIVLLASPGCIEGNHVTEAEGDLELIVRSVPTPGALEEGSALARINAEMLGAIYQTLQETLASEQIDVEMSGSLPSMDSLGLGGGIGFGVGILVLLSNGTEVSGNGPVYGEGGVDATVWSKESNEGQPAVGIGGGLGIGLGIAVIDSMNVLVESNTGVEGEGEAVVDVGAEHDPPVGAQNALAVGGGASVGIGILMCGLHTWNSEAEQLPEGECWYGFNQVIDNETLGTGEEANVEVSAVDLIPSHESLSVGGALSLGAGIAAIFQPWILIEDNVANGNGDAVVDVYSQAVHEFDPQSFGGAAGIGIGIADVASFASQIIGNRAVGEGVAEGEIGATEQVILEAGAFGGSLGLGKGILVFGSPFTLVKGNPWVAGLGDADTDVVAISYIPLQDAYAFALSFGLGKGIVVELSPCTKVIECNTTAGEGTARVSAEADADFDYEGALGVAADIDILVMLSPNTCVNYNSMVDTTPLGTNDGPVLVFDAGLFLIGPWLNAQFNWWNHPTGPSGFGPGNGEPVLWIGGPAWFTPWLYVEHNIVLEEQIGKFGFYIQFCKGLNTLSTPIALEEEVVPSRRWADIKANSGLDDDPASDFWNVKYVLRWDSENQIWEAVGDDTTLDPLDAWYIYLKKECLSAILMVNSDSGHPYAMPTRQLSDNWNLIGPNPLFPEPCIPVDEMLSSIEQTPAGLPGYTQAISPIVRCQPAWHFVPGMCPEDMLSGKGYWVFMENPDILAGFGFSPLPDKIY